MKMKQRYCWEYGNEKKKQTNKLVKWKALYTVGIKYAGLNLIKILSERWYSCKGVALHSTR